MVNGANQTFKSQKMTSMNFHTLSLRFNTSLILCLFFLLPSPSLHSSPSLLPLPHSLFLLIHSLPCFPFSFSLSPFLFLPFSLFSSFPFSLFSFSLSFSSFIPFLASPPHSLFLLIHSLPCFPSHSLFLPFSFPLFLFFLFFLF